MVSGKKSPVSRSTACISRPCRIASRAESAFALNAAVDEPLKLNEIAFDAVTPDSIARASDCTNAASSNVSRALPRTGTRISQLPRNASFPFRRRTHRPMIAATTASTQPQKMANPLPPMRPMPRRSAAAA